MKMIKPPKKLSALIWLALGDLVKVEKDKRYQVNMTSWHKPEFGRCNVCFAGSVMAKTLKTAHKFDADLNSVDFSYEWKLAFQALDAVRQGEIYDALDCHCHTDLSFKFLKSFYGMENDFWDEQISYYSDPKEFKEAMADIAVMLESHGL